MSMCVHCLLLSWFLYLVSTHILSLACSPGQIMLHNMHVAPVTRVCCCPVRVYWPMHPRSLKHSCYVVFCAFCFTLFDFVPDLEWCNLWALVFFSSLHHPLCRLFVVVALCHLLIGVYVSWLPSYRNISFVLFVFVVNFFLQILKFMVAIHVSVFTCGCFHFHYFWKLKVVVHN